jgi:MFS family permease
LVLAVVNLNEAICGNVIWPLLPFLVRRYSLPEDVGVYVGLLAASFFLGQVLFVRQWGRAADKWGRRPVLLIGLAGSVLTMTWFGCGRSYTEALLARFFNGAMNGNIAICKVYVGEVTDRHTQATGFAYLSLTWGLGTILAPAIGGFLGDAATQYPGSVLDVDVFRRLPYLLPSLVAAGYAAVAFTLAVFFLEETPAWRALQVHAAAVPERAAPATAAGAGARGGAQRPAEEGAEEGGEGEDAALLVDQGTPAKGPRGGAAGAASALQDTRAASLHFRVFGVPGMAPAIGAYALLSSVQILFDELLPVFASTPPAQGGLGWTSAEVGSVQVVNGGVQILTTLLLVPWLLRRLGVLAAFRAFMLPLAPYLALFPTVALLSGRAQVVFAVMCGAVAVRTVLFAVPFATIMIAINNLSPPQHLGLVVSSAQAVASAIRTVGPAFGGALFSIASAQEAAGPLRLEAVYLLMALLALATFFCAASIPHRCEVPPGGSDDGGALAA